MHTSEVLRDVWKDGEVGMTDIREVCGLWCDDITFCSERCGWKSCPRNKENIRDRAIPHSFSVEIPVDCPKRGKWICEEVPAMTMGGEVISTMLHQQKELVLCKDCKHGVLCNEGEIDCTKDIGTFKATIHEPNWFCADGER